MDITNDNHLKMWFKSHVSTSQKGKQQLQATYNEYNSETKYYRDCRENVRIRLRLPRDFVIDLLKLLPVGYAVPAVILLPERRSGPFRLTFTTGVH